MKKTIAIIGGGVSGLTAGIYAQQCGFETTIYEKHSVAGGLCSYWVRNGFMLDNCIHWLSGSRTDTELNRIWKNTHILRSDTQLFQIPFFLQVELGKDKIRIWRDLNKFRDEMLALSPEDKQAVLKFVQLIDTYKDTVVVANKPLDHYSIIDWAKLLYSMRRIGKVHKTYQRMSIREFALQFKHPLLRKMLLAYFPHYYNVSSMLYVFGIFCNGDADLPAGGSKGIVDRMTERYLSLGGKIEYNKEAKEILHEGKEVTAVCFRDDTMAKADFIIAACDLRYTITKLLREQYVDKYMREHFYTKTELYPTSSSVNVYLSVDTDEHILPGTMFVDCDDIVVNDKQLEGAMVKDFNYEPTFAPKGKGVIQVLITQYEDDFKYWKKLREENRKAYIAEKKAVAEKIKSKIEKRFEKLKGKLEILDVATPVTNARYTNSYMGAYMSFGLTPFNEKLSHYGRVPKLRNLYLAGQWLQAPGGLPNAVVTGKFAVQRICKDWKIPFVEA